MQSDRDENNPGHDAPLMESIYMHKARHTGTSCKQNFQTGFVVAGGRVSFLLEPKFFSLQDIPVPKDSISNRIGSEKTICT